MTNPGEMTDSEWAELTEAQQVAYCEDMQREVEAEMDRDALDPIDVQWGRTS